MGLITPIFTGVAANTLMQIADISPKEYVGEGFLSKMANIGGTGPTGPVGMA